MPLGPGLESDAQGSVQTAGSTPSEPSAYLYGSNGFVGLGTGLQLGPNGELEQGGGYIYCTPQYSYLPVTYPPYGCNTEVNTAGVSDFTEAWSGCNELENLPCVDTSSGTVFNSTWYSCYSLTSFPLLDVSSGTNFVGAWYSCTSLTSFPLLNVSSGTDFYGAWHSCTSLTSFPPLDFSSGTDFDYAWSDCSSLTTFPAGMFDSCLATNFNAWTGCALSQTSVDNILVSLDIAGQSNGIVNFAAGSSSAPGPAGLAAKASLEGKGWSVVTN